MSIEKRIEGMEEGLVSFLSEMIRIPTVNPPGDKYTEMIDFLEEKFQGLGMATERVLVPEKILTENDIDPTFPRIILIARMGEGKRLHMNGHYDVVPVNPTWKDAFQPKVEGNRLYGRGGCDMKGVFACYYFAIKALQEEGMALPALEICCVPDEETGSTTGMEFIADALHPTWALGEMAMEGNIAIGNKGLVWLEVEVIGKAAHGAHPEKGVNSLEKANELITALMGLKGIVQKRKTSYPTATDADSFASMVIGGKLEGGNKTNIIPQRTMFSIDRRVLPEEDVELAKDEIIAVIDGFRKNHPEVKVNVKVDHLDEPVVVDPGCDLCSKMVEAVAKVRGRPGTPKLFSGGTDLRFLIRKGIPALGYSPDGGNYHADGEWVSVSSLVETTKVYAELMRALVNK